MQSLKRRVKRLGWGYVPVVSVAAIAIFFALWELVGSEAIRGMPAETRRWLHLGQGVFGAACIALLTATLVRRHERRLAQLRQAMIQNEKLAVIGQMATGLAHEIGNPLASLSAMVQIQQRDHLTTSDLDRLKLMGREIDRIDGIVRRLVDFSRPATDESTRLDVAEVIDDAIDLARYDPRSARLRFDRRYSPHLPVIKAVREHLIQVFLNIIYNAMDAMPTGGTLTVLTAHRSGAVAIDFQDTGPGIPPEHAESVFEPFFTTKGRGRGSGLGLAVSRHLIEQQHGRITLRSDPGAGTTVCVTLSPAEVVGQETRDAAASLAALCGSGAAHA